MELLELISAPTETDHRWNCPFPHVRDEWKPNKIPPPEDVNDADKLSRNMGRSAAVPAAELPLVQAVALRQGVEAMTVGLSAHHVIPGNEIWNDKGHPLHAWIAKDAKGSRVRGDIGFDTNCEENGIYLPSNKKVPDWGQQAPDTQLQYATAAMSIEGNERQFHDSHKAYSEFVWNVLEKIAAKIDRHAGGKGCGHQDCGGRGNEKYAPPIGVLARLLSITERIKPRLCGAPATWRLPIMTSRFAMMYCELGLTQAGARKALSSVRKEMRGLRGRHG
jgi:hypothetical protein